MTCPNDARLKAGVGHRGDGETLWQDGAQLVIESGRRPLNR